MVAGVIHLITAVLGAFIGTAFLLVVLGPGEEGEE